MNRPERLRPLNQREVEVLFFLEHWPARSEGDVSRGITSVTGQGFSTGGVHDLLARLRSRELVEGMELTEQGRLEFSRLLSRFLESTRYSTDTIWKPDRDRGKGDRFGPYDAPYREWVRRGEIRLMLILLEAQKDTIKRLSQKHMKITTVGQLLENFDDVATSMYCDDLLERAVGRLPKAFWLELEFSKQQKQDPDFLVARLRQWLSSHPRKREQFNEAVFDAGGTRKMLLRERRDESLNHSFSADPPIARYE